MQIICCEEHTAFYMPNGQGGDFQAGGALVPLLASLFNWALEREPDLHLQAPAAGVLGKSLAVGRAGDLVGSVEERRLVRGKARWMHCWKPTSQWQVKTGCIVVLDRIVWVPIPLHLPVRISSKCEIRANLGCWAATIFGLAMSPGFIAAGIPKSAKPASISSQLRPSQ